MKKKRTEMTKKIYIEIDTDFVKPNSDCDACDTEYTCFECEHHQVKEKYPYSDTSSLG